MPTPFSRHPGIDAVKEFAANNRCKCHGKHERSLTYAESRSGTLDSLKVLVEACEKANMNNAHVAHDNCYCATNGRRGTLRKRQFPEGSMEVRRAAPGEWRTGTPW